MKILVTGANGQLGQAIQSVSFEYQAFNFVYTDIDELDILNKKDVNLFIQKTKPEFLINCSAYTAVDRAESEPESARKINAEGPSILAEEMNRAGGKMIHISTDYVFDGKKGSEYFEDDQINPESVYGKTKANGEQEVLKYPENIIIRTSWLYSTFGNNFFKTMLKLMSERDELKIVNDQYGTPSFAEDLAKMILKLINSIKSDSEISGIYHFANEGITNWYGFAKEIQELSKFPCHITGIPTSEYPTAAARPPYSVLNTEKIKKTLQLDIPNWKDSLKLCYEKLANNNL